MLLQAVVWQDIFLYSYFSIVRFDEEKECDRMDGKVIKNDPPAILNTGHPKIKKEVDCSCNELCTTMHM